MFRLLFIASVVAIAGGLDGVCRIDGNLRKRCGSVGIQFNQCMRLNCCFESPAPAGMPTCYERGDRCNMPGGRPSRFTCGGGGANEAACNAMNCCFRENGCFHPEGAVTIVEQTPAPAPAPSGNNAVGPFGGLSICNLGSIVDSVRNLIQSWRNIITGFRGIGSVLGVVDNVGIAFSIRTYCQIYALSINSIVECGALLQPLISLFGVDRNDYFRVLNDIEDSKGICTALLGGDPDADLCIPNAPAFCFVTSFDLLISVVKQVSNPLRGCMQTKDLLMSIPKCIDSSTKACEASKRGDLEKVKEDTMRVVGILGTACDSGCTQLASFFLDKHETCSWNFARVFPDNGPTGYCEVLDRTVQCAYEMWTLCPLLPRKYFERALSASLQANNLVGCNPIVLPDYVPNDEYQVKFPPCLVAASDCTRAVGGILGFTSRDSEFGGFSFTEVGDKLREMRDMLIQGDFAGLCGPKNDNQSPLSYCINGLVNECGASTENMKAREISMAVAANIDDICDDGCITLSKNVFKSENTCGTEIQTLFNGTNVANVAWEVIKGVIEFDSNNEQTCTALRNYVACLAMVLEDCPFFHKRVGEIRGAIVSALSKIPNYRPLEIIVCGIKLDYPFEFTDARLPSIVVGISRNAASQQWITILTVSLFIILNKIILQYTLGKL